MRELGLAAKGPERVYLTGGTSAVLHGWRTTTVDVDLKLAPEPAGIFEALRDLISHPGAVERLSADMLRRYPAIDVDVPSRKLDEALR